MRICFVTDQAKPDKLPVPRWRRVMRIGIEVLLILVMLSLIGAFLAPVIKGPSPTIVKPPATTSSKPS
jgi:hypothetical protein